MAVNNFSSAYFSCVIPVNRILGLTVTLVSLVAGIALAPPAASASSRTQAPGPRIIEYYGDSTVWGYATGTGSQVARPAPAVFAESLPPSLKFEVRNHGVSGSTACQLLQGKDDKHPAWDIQMASSKASVVIFNHAINDQWKDDLATYKSCLLSLARIATKNGKQVIFETPNPTMNSGPGGLDAYVDAMKEVAARLRLPVIDQYRFLTEFLQGASPYTICPDGLHPSDDIYMMKGKYAATVFITLLHRN